jgi:hypothetical protein
MTFEQSGIDRFARSANVDATASFIPRKTEVDARSRTGIRVTAGSK